MQKITVTAFLAFCVGNAQAGALSIPDCFLGRWRSNEALTLASMRGHPEVTDKAAAFLENKFFGRLVLVYGRSRGAAYLEPDENRNSLVFEPYHLLRVTKSSAVFGTSSEDTSSGNEWFCEPGRIYALVTKWKFREYFTPE